MNGRLRPIVTVIVLAIVIVAAGCSGTPANGQAPTETTSTLTTGTERAPITTQTPTSETTGTTTTSDGSNGTLELHFINVGQAESTLVVGPTNETLLIDTGDFTDDGEHVIQYLKRQNITRIDYLVSTHADADHIGGNAALIEYFETQAEGIGAVYDPGIAASTQTYEAYLDAVERYNVTLYETRADDTIPLDGVQVDVLGPPDPYLADRERNENSIVLHLSYGATSVLFTGDAGPVEEQYLLDEYGVRLNATVLKAGHHGSRDSTGPALLDAVMPRVVVISSAYDSQYGHPHEELRQRLAARLIPTYWTATHGDIVLVSDGRTLTIKTQQAGPTDPSALREGTPIDPGATAPLEVRRTITVDARPTQPGTTQPGTTTVTDGGTDTSTATRTSPSTTETSPLVVESVHADAAGDEYENLNDEYVVFGNDGDQVLNLGGWTVSDASGHTYRIPDGVTLAPGETLTLHSGQGEGTSTDLYWGAAAPIWNNGGDTVTVTNADGDRALIHSY